MLIGGLQKLTLIDFPKKLAAIVFTQGCPFRCHYCHNSELVLPKKFKSPILEKDFFDFLKTRVGKLDAVVITGGEPTIQSDLIIFIKKIKEMGFLVKLDTSGINPHILSFLIKSSLLDYIAMDIKAPLPKYHKIIGKRTDLKKIQESIEVILSSSLAHEFRTTLLKSLLTEADIIEIAETIKGADLFAIQKFIPTTTINPLYINNINYSDQILEDLRINSERYVKKCIIR